MNTYILMTWLIAGSVAMLLLVLFLIFFGSVIWLQMRVWILARKGYYQIRHIREDKVEKYYYLRVVDGKYEFDKGVYIAQKDGITKTENVLNKFDYNLLSNKPETELNALEKEVLKFLIGLKNSKVMDITTLSWGIPTVTYYGNNPNPINYSEMKKLHDAKNISALIKRIIMTKEWKLVRIVLMLCVIALGLWVVLGFLDYNFVSGLQKQLDTCHTQLNVTQYEYLRFMNKTLEEALIRNNPNSYII